MLFATFPPSLTVVLHVSDCVVLEQVTVDTRGVHVLLLVLVPPRQVLEHVPHGVQFDEQVQHC